MTSHVEGMEIQKRRIAILKEAASLVERGWVKLDMARDGKGRSVGPRWDDACSWCLHGAVIAATAKLLEDDDMNRIRREVRLAIGAVAQYALGVVPASGWLNNQSAEQIAEDWNDADGRTQDEVIRALAQTAEHIGSMVPGCLHD